MKKVLALTSVGLAVLLLCSGCEHNARGGVLPTTTAIPSARMDQNNREVPPTTAALPPAPTNRIDEPSTCSNEEAGVVEIHSDGKIFPLTLGDTQEEISNRLSLLGIEYDFSEDDTLYLLSGGGALSFKDIAGTLVLSSMYFGSAGSSTQQGISVGSSLDELFETYGIPTYKDHFVAITYVYLQGKYKLSFSVYNVGNGDKINYWEVAIDTPEERVLVSKNDATKCYLRIQEDIETAVSELTQAGISFTRDGPNGEGFQLDTCRAWFGGYPGESYPDCYLYAYEVTSKEISTPQSVGIGSTVKDIFDIYGSSEITSDWEDRESYEYAINNDGTARIGYVVQDNIVMSWYVTYADLIVLAPTAN